MFSVVVAIFAAVYAGMMIGRLPFLAMDRTGIALLGAIAMIGIGALTPEEAWRAVDVSTMGLLLGLMVVSAQFELSGFYTTVTRRVAAAELTPPALLALVMAVAAGFSALLCNDIVCLAVAPLLVEGCAQRGLNPKPYLFGLACAANIGSAATLIGNPQNMLIGQSLNLPFAGYLGEAIVPVLLGLVAAWAIIARQSRMAWHASATAPHAEGESFNSWQMAKGTVVLLFALSMFLFVPVPREIVALAAAGMLLTSRKMHTHKMLGEVDWHLLVLFGGLFIVHGAFAHVGADRAMLDFFRNSGVDLARPGVLFVTAAILSNLVSNVPATMLLLPAATHPQAGPILALSSTLAGNLILVGSIANLIVADQAARAGVAIGWREHARLGVPVTLASLAIAAGWIALRSL